MAEKHEMHEMHYFEDDFRACPYVARCSCGWGIRYFTMAESHQGGEEHQTRQQAERAGGE